MWNGVNIVSRKKLVDYGWPKGNIMHSIFSKWMIYAFQLGESNLQIFVYYRINSAKPNKSKKWGFKVEYIFDAYA
jgi:hypothetical protein